MSGDALSCGDLLLWERYTTKDHQADGSVIVTLAPGNMPDGKPCQARFAAGWKPRVVIEQWYQYVTGEANAREAKQAAEAVERAEASRTGSQREDPAPRIYGGSELPTAAAVQAREASVESIIESKISDLGGSITRVEEQIAATLGALKSLELERGALKQQRSKAVAALKAMKGAHDDDAS